MLKRDQMTKLFKIASKCKIIFSSQKSKTQRYDEKRDTNQINHNQTEKISLPVSISDKREMEEIDERS